MNSPNLFYRFFENKEHRDEFMRGIVRFGKLEIYRNIEDENIRDENEGRLKGKYSTNVQTLIINQNKVVNNKFLPGDMNVMGESLNTHFIYSLCGSNINLKGISKKFNKRYVVQISNIQKIETLLNQKCNFEWRQGIIQLVQVKYNRDENITMNENQTIPYEYNFAQKSKKYSDEDEWRFVLTCKFNCKIGKDYVEIQIGAINDITKIIDIDL